MRIAAGPHRVTATDGTILHLDQPASRETVDQLAQTIRQAGLTPADVISVNLHSDGPPTIRTVAEIEAVRQWLDDPAYRIEPD